MAVADFPSFFFLTTATAAASISVKQTVTKLWWRQPYGQVSEVGQGSEHAPPAKRKVGQGSEHAPAPRKVGQGSEHAPAPRRVGQGSEHAPAPKTAPTAVALTK